MMVLILYYIVCGLIMAGGIHEQKEEKVMSLVGVISILLSPVVIPFIIGQHIASENN